MWMISLATIWAHTASRKHLIVGKAHVNKQQNGKSHGIDIVAKPQTNLISFFACLFSGPTRSSWFFWLPLSLLPHQQGTADRDTLQLFLFIIKKKKKHGIQWDLSAWCCHLCKHRVFSRGRKEQQQQNDICNVYRNVAADSWMNGVNVLLCVMSTDDDFIRNPM